jgi:hypothetical protein
LLPIRIYLKGGIRLLGGIDLCRAIDLRIGKILHGGCTESQILEWGVLLRIRGIGHSAGQEVLLVPVVSSEEPIPTGDEIGDAHAIVPEVSAGLSDVAAQSDGVFEFGRDGEDAEDVSVTELSLESGIIESKLVHLPAPMVFDPLEKCAVIAGEI